MTLEDGADWPVVTGERFRERRIHLNLTQSELADEAGIKSYETVGAVERGEGSPTSRRRIEDALVRLEAEVGLHAQASAGSVEAAGESAAPGVIRFKVEGVYGAKALVVEGPVENLAELEEMVDRVMRRLANQDDADTEK